MQQTVENLMHISSLDPDVYCKVQGYIYSSLSNSYGTSGNLNNNVYDVIAVITDQSINIPVQPISINYHDLQKLSNANGIKHFITDMRSLYDEIDDVIAKGPTNEIDIRIQNVKKNMYENESYELFRLELSEFLHQHLPLKNKIITYITSEKLDKISKKDMIKRALFKTLSKELLDIYNTVSTSNDDLEGGTTSFNVQPSRGHSLENDIVINLINNMQDGKDNSYPDQRLQWLDAKVYKALGGDDEEEISLPGEKVQTNFIELVPEIPKDVILNYTVNNNREVCKINNKAACKENPHCTFAGSCKFILTKQSLIYYINRIADELLSNKLKSSELLKIDNYRVSDIVNAENFKERDGQKIIKSINYNIQKILPRWRNR